MAEDEDVDGEPMEEDFDGEPMDEDKDVPEPPPQEEIKPIVKADTAPVGQPRRRPRAVDMFADSDDSDS